jgi:hypothetical protein
LDSTDIAAGAELSRELKETVENSDALLVVLSKSAAQSSWVMAEVGLAQSLNKRVLPVLALGANYEDSVPPQLLNMVVLDANKLPMDELAARIIAVVKAIPIETALDEVRSKALRRQRYRWLLIASFTLLTVAGVWSTYFALDAKRKLLASEEIIHQSASLAVAPDGKTVAIGYSNGGIAILDAKTNRERAILGSQNIAPGIVTALAYSPDSRILASAGWNGVVELWDVSQEVMHVKLVLKGHTKAVLSLQFSPDGKVLYTRSIDGTLRAWRTADGTTISIEKIGSENHGAH